MDDSVIGAFQQAGRLIEIDTPLGKDVFLLERFTGKEKVNDLFEFEAAVRSKLDNVQAADIVGKNVNVTLELGEGNKRSWNALVTNLVEEPRLTRGFRRYALTLRPDLWLLSQRSDCRIWQNQTTQDVATTLLSEHGLPAPEIHLQNPPQPKLYSVQWNETDLNYLLRRLEEDGLFYFIRQKDNSQKLVIADHPVYWDKGADGGTGRERYAAGSADRNHITSWRRNFVFTPGKRAGRDWNFQTPTTVPGSDATSSVKLPRNGSYELYEYPARALTNDAASKAMSLRMKAVEGGHQTIEAASTVRTLAPGAKVTPYDVANPDNKFDTAVVMEIEHEAVGPTYETNSENQPSYSNRFSVMPADLPATPHRQTPRPRIDGSQIAMIAGPKGEEIYTDEFGRVKLWHFWDRRAKKDGSDTCWIRVAQPWAGGSWGVQVIPRIGMEAVVTFEGGDPDRPIVTALVPNPVQKVPYNLPSNKTRMVIKSKTHKGVGFNEMRFEDEKGQEEYYMHAQKDMNVKVLHDRTKEVDHDQTERVGNNKTIMVGSNHMETIKLTKTMVVGGIHNELIGADMFVKVGVNRDLTVGKSLNQSIGENKTEMIARDSALHVGNVKDTRVGKTYYIDVGEEMHIVCGKAFTIQVGQAMFRMNADGTISREGKVITESAVEKIDLSSAIVKVT